MPERKTHLSLAVPLLALFGANPVLRGQPILYVDQDATGVNNGSSWCDGYVRLQDAFAHAAAAGGAVTEIRVAEGSYFPDRRNATPSGSGDRNAAFALINGVALRGGYAGCGAPDPNFRDTGIHQTILDGDLNGNDVLLNSPAACASAGGTWYDVVCDKVQNNGENSYQVVVSINNNSTAILDGVVILNGNADGPSLGATPASKDQGPAVNVYHGTPRIIDCRFENHRAINHGAINDHGGATLIDCEFRRNFATRWAGGLHIEHGVTTIVSGTEFHQNATAGTDGGGGGITNKGGTLVLTDSTLLNNYSAVQGGGIYNAAGSTTTLTDCTIAQNRAKEFGGGMYSALATNLQATRVTFDSNSLAGGVEQHGGGVYNLPGTFLFRDCSFMQNSARYGGGAYQAGANGVQFERTEFLNNIAVLGGGGVYNYGASPSFTDCTFRGNRSDDPGYGGAMGNTGGSPTILRCVFESNHAEYGGAGVSNESSSPTIADSYFSGNTVGQNGGALYYLNTSSSSVTGCTFVANSSANLGGAVLARNNVQLNLDRCRFMNNSGVSGGGGVYVQQVTGSISNSLFVANSSSLGFGGAISAGGSIPANIANCTFVRNTAGNFAGALYGAAGTTITNSIFWENSDASGMNDIDQVAGILAIRECDVQGWTGVLGGTGNFSANPLFVNMLGADGMAGTADDNLRLQAGSPCIDTGDNSAAIGLYDLEGSPRVSGSAVDLGALERLGSCGNATCDAGEDSCNCPDDCGPALSSENACADGLDNDCDQAADCLDSDCEVECGLVEIPAASTWGLVTLSLLILICGSVAIGRRSPWTATARE